MSRKLLHVAVFIGAFLLFCSYSNRLFYSKSFILNCMFRKKVNITCNSWKTSYPYHYYNFYLAFLLIIHSFFLSFRRRFEIHMKSWHYVYNKQMPHGKCFVRYLRARSFCIRNLTRSISDTSTARA